MTDAPTAERLAELGHLCDADVERAGWLDDTAGGGHIKPPSNRELRYLLAQAKRAGASDERVRAAFDSALDDWDYESDVARDVQCLLLNLGSQLLGSEWAEKATDRIEALSLVPRPDEGAPGASATCLDGDARQCPHCLCPLVECEAQAAAGRAGEKGR